MRLALPRPVQLLRRLARQWAYRRQGPDTSPLLLHRRRIYILPTRLGMGLLVVIAAIILAAMNYANSMGFFLGFSLAGLALVSMYHAHRGLNGLVVKVGQPGEGFVDEAQRLTVDLESRDRIHRHDLLLTDSDGNWLDVTDLPAMSSATLGYPITPEQRGPIRVRRFGLACQYPFGLFQAWCWLDLPLEGLAWPRPLDHPLQHARHPDGEGKQQEEKGSEDFSRLRGYVSGDPIRRMAWRHYLNRGELVIKEFASPSGESTIWFDWDQAGPGDTETRLGRLCHWILQAELNNRPWGLRLPDQTIEPGQGSEQSRRALNALARFGLEGERHA
ncbi:DUF58 domain-containing protein [Gammaproteobacteria bacterium AB-CW1]|uniref:DUF58 domain-containing protein n=1 Tax=Natronospira elongata TaxID=3110268 RepID=A0AAP6JDW5_9GAMM|nr:DUF58 domain-containing protein [Gammaproteobacteria bacterium AB-CW1]